MKDTIISRVLKWVNDRWPLSTLLRLSLEEEIPGGSRFAYTLGSATLIVFLLQAVSGVMQLIYYVPTVDHAYDSISYLRTEVPFGWLIHGLHFWGANAMIILVVLHMARVFIWAAYKSPRELTWLIGTAQLVVIMALSFTGTPLHWDQRGYWAAEVGTSIAGSAPVVGNLIKQIMRGGETISQLTLSRFFAAHIYIFPPLLLTLIGAHLIALRSSGSVGPWDETTRAQSGPFWPDQVFKDAVTGTVVFLILLALIVFAPPGFYGPADTLDTFYVPKAEWNLLFLYESLKFFPGRLEPVGSVGIPTVLVLALVLLPFLDRKPERNPFRRPIAMLCGLIYIAFLLGFTIAGYYSKGYGQAPVTQKLSTASIGKTTVPQSPGSSQGEDAVAIAKGSEIFASQRCSGCHRINRVGGRIGPDLSGEGKKGHDRKWLADQIRNPKSHFPNSVMPAFTSLSDQEVNSLVAYLMSLEVKSSSDQSGLNDSGDVKKSAVSTAVNDNEQRPPSSNLAGKGFPGQAAFIIGSAKHGAILFEKNCFPCHGSEGKGGIPNMGSDEKVVPPLNPVETDISSPDPRIFADNIDRMIQHGSVPAGPNPALRMPAFGDTNSLTQQEISNLEAYIMSLNNVDRAKLIHPGMMPRHFFFLVISVFVIVIFILGGLRSRGHTGSGN
jgi:ubiquinol-cytochrome c reductase cytochrome b subunit